MARERFPDLTYSIAALIAPHSWCPRTRISDDFKTATEYSIDPKPAGSTKLPATRTPKMLPGSWSNTVSTGTRESEHETRIANGLCPPTSCVRRLERSPHVGRPETKRAFPLRKRSNASPSAASAAVCEAAATLKPSAAPAKNSLRPSAHGCFMAGSLAGRARRPASRRSRRRRLCLSFARRKPCTRARHRRASSDP